MNIYIMSTVINGYTATDILVENLNVQGIITLIPDAGKRVNEYYDFKMYCQNKKIEYIGVETYTLNNENDKKAILDFNIDVLLVLGWQRLIPEWLINHCNIGAIGGHGSPWGITEGRGRSPQNWALLMGMKKFYVSIFWLDIHADSGNIIDTREMEYTDVDDINSSYLKCGILAANMIIQNIKNGRISLKEGEKQEGDGSYLPQRIADDGEIDWSRNGEEIYNFVRALTKPYPGAFTKIRNGVIYIWHVIYLNIESEVWNCKEEGTILQIQPNGQLIVKCRDGLICIDDCEMDGEIEIREGDIFQSCDFKMQIGTIIKRHYSKYNTDVNRNIRELI